MASHTERTQSQRIAALIVRLREADPDLVEAAGEQDVDLLSWFATLTPAERLDRAGRTAVSLERLRDARADT